MEMTLRQAHKTIDKINARINKLNVNTHREVGIWGMEANEIEKLTVEFEAELKRLLDLTNARSEMRLAIKLANQSNVDRLIACRKSALDHISVLRTIVAGVDESNVYDQSALNAKAAAARAAAGSGGSVAYGRADMISVCTVSAFRLKELNDKIDALQLEVESIEDDLTAHNSDRSNMVTVAYDVADLLKRENLIA